MPWTIDIKNSALDNPRINGKALQGALSSYWRYRVGDYHLICQIRDHELIVLVVEVATAKTFTKNLKPRLPTRQIIKGVLALNPDQATLKS